MLYLVTGVLTVALQQQNGPSPWYPPVAVGIALIVFGGWRWVPFIAAAELVISGLQYRFDADAVVLVAFPATLESVAGAWLVQRVRLRLESPTEVLQLGGIATAAPVLGASVGVIVGVLAGSEVGTPQQWLEWVLGDATAITSILPLMLFLGWYGWGVFGTGSRRVDIEATIVNAASALLVVFTTWLSMQPPSTGIFRFFWALPVIYAAIRVGRRGAIWATLVIALTSFVTLRWFGIVPNLAQEIGAQSAIIAIGLGGLGIATALHQRREVIVELQAALAKIEASEQWYTKLFDASPTMQVLVDPANGAIVDVNDAAATFYGHTRAEMLGTSVNAYTLSAPQVVAERMEVASGGAQIMVGRHRVADGAERTMELRTGIVRIDGRDLIHLVLRDITAELEARTEVARLAAAVESSADAIVTTDLEGIITGWNSAATVLYGYAREEAVGRNVEELLGAVEMRQDLVAEAAMRGESLVLGQVVRHARDGEEIPVELTVSPIIDDGHVVGMSRINHDLRHILSRERELRRSRAMLAEAAAVGQMGSFEWNSDTLENVWSDELFRIAGVGRDFDSTRYLELVHPEDRAAFAAAMETLDEEPHEIAVRMTRPDGEERATIVRWRSIIEPAVDPRTPPIVRRVGIVRDVTDERALELQLRQAQRLESIGLLAGGVAHDFNNLLTAIGGFTELARMTAADGGSPDDELTQVMSAVGRAQSLTQQLLAFGRRAIVRPQPVDVSRAVDDLVPMLRRLLGEKVAITSELEPGAGAVIDPGALDQLLVNLAVNARDAMPDGGNLRIAVGTIADAGAPAGFHTWIEVEDDGVGIPPEIRDQVFLPFFTTKERGQGTGLGLSTVQGIVAMAGGTISLDSEPGEGTTFRIVLPGTPVEALAPVAPTPVRDWQGSGLVLLVEDEALVRRVAERVLGAAGWRIASAANVPDALVLADRERPDILVTDIVLPGVSDGIALAESLRERWPSLPVLLTTGYTEREPPAWADLLQKPYDTEVLVNTVRRLLDEARAAAADEPGSDAVEVGAGI